MNIIDQIPVQFQFPCENLSCILYEADRISGMNQWSSELCSMNNKQEAGRIHLSHPYDRITYCPQTGGYFAICWLQPECIFVLDAEYQEIDCLKLRSNEFHLPMNDIWYDPQSQLLWIVTAIRIYILNCNGDLLDTFMIAPMGTEYKALCTYSRFAFVAFLKGTCLYLASYTNHGVYLEQVSLGSGYTVRNVQPVSYRDGVCLNMFVLKDHRFPTVLKIDLPGHRKTASYYEKRCDVVITCNEGLSDC